jgi:predicted RNase H-like nuclease (RuvC/YqgF family)
MSEIIEIKLEDFQRLAEENENLQKIIKDKNQRIIFLEDKLNECEEKINIHTQSDIANNKQFGRHKEITEEDKVNYYEKFKTD